MNLSGDIIICIMWPRIFWWWWWWSWWWWWWCGGGGGGLSSTFFSGATIWTPLNCHGGSTFSLIYIYYLQFFYLIKSHSACLNMYLHHYQIFGSTALFHVAHWPIFGPWPPQFSSSNSVCFVPLASSFVYGSGRLHLSVHSPSTCYLVFLLALFHPKLPTLIFFGMTQ